MPFKKIIKPKNIYEKLLDNEICFIMSLSLYKTKMLYLKIQYFQKYKLITLKYF